MTDFEELRARIDRILEKIVQKHCNEYTATVKTLLEPFDKDLFDLQTWTQHDNRDRPKTDFPQNTGFVRLDKNGAICFCSEAAASFLRLREMASGMLFEDMLDPPSRDSFINTIQQIDTDMKADVCELHFVHNNRWALSIITVSEGAPEIDDESRLVWDVTLVDSTDRKTALQALQRSHADFLRHYQSQQQELQHAKSVLSQETSLRNQAEQALNSRQHALESVYAIATAFDAPYQSLVEQIVLSVADLLRAPCVMMIRVDESGSVALVTEKKRLSCDPDAVAVGGNVLHWLAAQARPFCESGDLDFATFIRRDLRPAQPLRSLLGVPILKRNGASAGVLVVIDDQRTFTHEEIRLVQIFARYLAHEMMHVTLENKLVRAERMNVLGQLASGVAHEVRNPLNAIIAIMEALGVEIGGKSDYEPYLDHMRSQIDRLTNLMEDLLALGRPLTPRDLKVEPVSTLVHACVAPLRKLFETSERQILVVTPEAADQWRVRADQNRIAQVFTNVIENAVQHSPLDAPIQVSILEPRGARAVFRITDRGSGITGEALRRMYEPFFTTRKSGTGLGLFIVKHIIESHGGSVAIFPNEPLPGTTVEFELPLLSW